MPARGHADPFAELVRQVASDPDNAYNVEQHLWVLEEDPPGECASCGRLFDPAVGYHGELARGLPRKYCSPACSQRAAYRRHRQKVAAA
jgi:hypothetical protein